jgi:hypothetical protein
MKAVSTSETSINFYQTTRRNIPEDSHFPEYILGFSELTSRSVSPAITILSNMGGAPLHLILINNHEARPISLYLGSPCMKFQNEIRFPAERREFTLWIDRLDIILRRSWTKNVFAQFVFVRLIA